MTLPFSSARRVMYSHCCSRVKQLLHCGSGPCNRKQENSGQTSFLLPRTSTGTGKSKVFEWGLELIVFRRKAIYKLQILLKK